MKQVISASRRSDIPAFYLKWFMKKIRQGFVEVPNPFNRKQIRQVSLSPGETAWIVLWSRNYSTFLKNYKFFGFYWLFFHFTINPAHSLLEPDMISPLKAIKQLEKLVAIYGPEVIIWRYDPLVFFSQQGQVESNHQPAIFRRYLQEISQLGIQKCYTSFAFLYPKVLKRARQQPQIEFLDPAQDQKIQILQEMVDLASLYGVQIYSCSNDNLLKVSGIKKGHCIDGLLLNRLGTEPVSERPAPTRPDCGCTVSIDIGDYLKTACKYHCRYCYARR
jgi:hypothetical protein